MGIRETFVPALFKSKHFPMAPLIIASLVFASLLVALPTALGEMMVKEMKPMMDETHHLEVKPESLEGYRLPYMKVTATIIDQETKEKKTIELQPMFGGNFHYGVNVALKPKQYLLKFHLDPPTLGRTGIRANQWLDTVEPEFILDASAQFEKSIKIGSKETQDMKISFEAEHAESMFVLEGAEQPMVMSTPSSWSVITLYIVFLVFGVVLGYTISRYTKK